LNRSVILNSGLFGARIEIVLKVWPMLLEDGLRPKKSKPKHLLWTLYFLKVYPKRGTRLLHCWRVEGCHRPEDPAEMGVALH
jgi:hypothetical protein